MSRPAILTRAIRADLRAELHWIGPDNLPKARALSAEILLAAQQLGDRPLLGRQDPVHLPPPFRLWSLARFQLIIVYNAEANPPRFLRLLSTARDLGPLFAGISAQD